MSRRSRRLTGVFAAVAFAVTACDPQEDGAASSEIVNAGPSIEFRNESGPFVDAPDRAMAMTVDAVEVADDDILVRLRVENREESYLDLGVQDAIYGPLLVMRDDRDNVYEAYAVEPAGIPGRRMADLSFRLAGPLDRDGESFTLELATQRGPLTSPSGALPEEDGVRWRVDAPAAEPPTSGDTGPSVSDPVFAAAPRLPDLIHFWLDTDPLPADR